MIEVKHLRKSYGDHDAVADVSLRVEEGEIFGVVGRNGAGKTTTVECIAGLRTPDAGVVRVLGLDPRRDRPRLRRVLGVQLQSSELPERMRVGEAVELFAAFHEHPADPADLLDRWDLTRLRRRAYRALSGGERQRLSIALALVGNPRVAVLDELTTGLDPQARRDTWSAIERIRDDGITVVLVTHLMEEAERLCDRVAVIDAGRVLTVDTPAALVAALPAGQRLRFRPAGTVTDAELLALPGVASVARHGTRIEVGGSGDLVTAVTTALAARGVIATDLRVEQAGLEDAFVALTGTAAGTDAETAAVVDTAA